VPDSQLIILVLPGVSGLFRCLVRQDFSAESRERVLEAAAELGYHPDTAARMLSRGRSRHLGVLFTMRQPHDIALVEGIYPAAERLGYAVALGATGPARDEQKAVRDLLGYRIEALILIGPYLDREGLATLAGQLRSSRSVAGSTSPGSSACCRSPKWCKGSDR